MTPPPKGRRQLACAPGAPKWERRGPAAAPISDASRRRAAQLLFRRATRDAAVPPATRTETRARSSLRAADRLRVRLGGPLRLRHSLAPPGPRLGAGRLNPQKAVQRMTREIGQPTSRFHIRGLPLHVLRQRF
ncbi:MAG: hypothetical protein ABIO94_00155 [Opitutaceae bacterium]